jgi:hypothetical protein
MKKTLNVGDTVLWSGSWGGDTPKKAKVMSIEKNCKGTKNGTDTDKISWSKMDSRDTVLDLDNGFWCYGFQVKQIE